MFDELEAYNKPVQARAAALTMVEHAVERREKVPRTCAYGSTN